MLLEYGTLVLVLDGAQMSLYRNTGKALHVELELLYEKRQHIANTASLGSAAPGRSFASIGERRSSHAEADLHTREEERFIKECIERLENSLSPERKAAVIIASPRALGIARSSYSPALRKKITAEIDRDYAGRTARDIAALLSSR